MEEQNLKRIKEHEKITDIVDDYCKVVDEYGMKFDAEAKKIIDSLKENCETYGELIIKIKRLKTTISWGGKPIIMSLIDRCEKLVKEEMNDLKIITEEKMTLNEIRKKYDLPEAEGNENNSVLVKVKLDK